MAPLIFIEKLKLFTMRAIARARMLARTQAPRTPKDHYLWSSEPLRPFTDRPRKPNKPLIFIEKQKLFTTMPYARTRVRVRKRACTRARTHAVTDQAFNFQKSSVSPIGFTHVSAHT
jgi:hypothetical protein